MSENELFRTARMGAMRGLTPAYMPGTVVYLQREVQGFPKGSEARVVSIQSTRPGEHRYQLTIGDQKMWSFEADIRPTPPPDATASLGNSGNHNALVPTQRMQTMTLSQRMANLGANPTQRMHALSQEERLKKLVQTNRLRTLATGPNPLLDTTSAPASGTGSLPPAAPKP